MNKVMLIIIYSSFLLLSACGGSGLDSEQKKERSKKTTTTIKTIWDNSKSSYISGLRASLNKKGLYCVQITALSNIK